MARYIRKVRDFNGNTVSHEDSHQPLPRVTQGQDWYQPGYERPVVRHVRQVDFRQAGEPTVQTIVTVGLPISVPRFARS
jgi:hypothetical protein